MKKKLFIIPHDCGFNENFTTRKEYEQGLSEKKCPWCGKPRTMTYEYGQSEKRRHPNERRNKEANRGSEQVF